MIEQAKKPSHATVPLNPPLFVCAPKNIHTDKKRKLNFPLHKEIHMGAVVNSYMRKGFVIYEEMRKYLTMSEEAVSHI
jgi:hypothetical protein